MCIEHMVTCLPEENVTDKPLYNGGNGKTQCRNTVNVIQYTLISSAKHLKSVRRSMVGDGLIDIIYLDFQKLFDRIPLQTFLSKPNG